ncbi:MAG: hypothetical protein ABIJ75_11120 [Actinomycetota bacterium]
MTDQTTEFLRKTMAAIVEVAPPPPDLPAVPIGRPERRWSPVLVVAGAFAVTLLALGSVMLYLSGDPDPGEQVAAPDSAPMAPARQADVMIFMTDTPDDDSLIQFANQVLGWEHVIFAETWDQTRTLAEFNELFADQPEILEIVAEDPSGLPVSVRVWTDSPAAAPAIVARAEGLGFTAASVFNYSPGSTEPVAVVVTTSAPIWPSPTEADRAALEAAALYLGRVDSQVRLIRWLVTDVNDRWESRQITSDDAIQNLTYLTTEGFSDAWAVPPQDLMTVLPAEVSAHLRGVGASLHLEGTVEDVLEGFQAPDDGTIRRAAMGRFEDASVSLLTWTDTLQSDIRAALDSLGRPGGTPTGGGSHLMLEADGWEVVDAWESADASGGQLTMGNSAGATLIIWTGTTAEDQADIRDMTPAGGQSPGDEIVDERVAGPVWVLGSEALVYSPEPMTHFLSWEDPEMGLVVMSFRGSTLLDLTRLLEGLRPVDDAEWQTMIAQHPSTGPVTVTTLSPGTPSELVIEGIRVPYTFEETQAYGEFGPVLWGLVTTIGGVEGIPHGPGYEWVTWGPLWGGSLPGPNPYDVYGVTNLLAVDVDAIAAVIPQGQIIVLREVRWSLDELEDFKSVLNDGAPDNGVCSTGFDGTANRIRLVATADLDLGGVPLDAVAVETVDECPVFNNEAPVIPGG